MTPDERTPFEIRIKTALVVLGIFLAGAAAGAGLYRWTGPRFPHRPPLMGVPFHELGLSADQEVKARAIGERHRHEMDAILRSTFPQVRAIHEQMEQELRETLTDEQHKKLDELKARRPPLPPGGPHPRHPGMGGPPGWGPPPGFYTPPPPPLPTP